MSGGFTEEVRGEIMSRLPSAKCCRAAMLGGLLVNAEAGLDGSVMYRLTSAEAASTAAKFIKSLFGSETSTSEVNCYGRRVCVGTAGGEGVAELVRSMSDPVGDDGKPAVAKCPNCGRYLISGLIMSSATFGDPGKSPRAEIKINDTYAAERLSRFFSEEGMNPSVSSRKGTGSLLFRRAEDVESLLAFGGAKNCAMKAMQGKLVREFRADVNRRSNFEFKNIGRTAGAAGEQTAAIMKIASAGLLDTLPEVLRETAKLRLDNPEAPLSELASMHSPAISKSGLSHRLARIAVIASELDGRNGHSRRS